MEQELETKDLKRVNPNQQRVNHHRNQIGYQIQNQKLNLSSMESAATESEYYNTNSSRSQSQNERKSNQKNKQKMRRRSISFSSQSSRKTSRSQSRSRSQKRSRTPSPWPRISTQSRYQNKKKQQIAGLSAIQQKTCKYWINGLCNQPAKCQYAHYKFGKIIQEHNKEFSNLKNINQSIRDGLIMVKLSVYRLISEEELKAIIRNNDEFIAKEVEISYQNSKNYKKMKKQINLTKKNKIMSQNEKKLKIRDIVYDSSFHLQINNNEQNASKREEAINKKKAKREEKRVQKQLEIQNQNLLQEKIKNLILQQNITSPNQQYQSDDEINEEEDNKNQNDDASQEQQMILENNNKYTQIINQNEQSINYNDVTNQYSNDIEDSSQQIILNDYQSSESYPAQTKEQVVNLKKEATHAQPPPPIQIPQEVLINNYTQNNAALNQLLSQNNNNKQQIQSKEEKISAEEHDKQVQQYIAQMSPPPKNKNQQTKSNYQLFKELKSRAIKQETNDLMKNSNLMDSTKSADSETTREMELKYSLDQLYDWKFICQQKLYISSTTQNVFNLQSLQKNKYDNKQLLSYNTTMKDIEMLGIPNPCKLTIKENVAKDSNNPKIKNVVVVFNKKIADQIFNAYTTQEIQRQTKEYTTNYNNKQAKMNDIHIFVLVLAQLIRKVVNLNFATEETEIPLKEARYMEVMAEFCKVETAEIAVFEVLNEDETYKVYVVKQDENPTPFYNKQKQIFQ